MPERNILGHVGQPGPLDRLAKSPRSAVWLGIEAHRPGAALSVLLRFCAKTACRAGSFMRLRVNCIWRSIRWAAAPKERRHGGAIVGDVLACRCGSRQY